eukprot:GHRQ01004373.1.p3 GENE.GHRQ01004373.1~~GHRQ01004373.1.p3  ORF type:complete len:117 (-),score=9.48 GHRQ01004373.1:776-1126(-)
MHSAYMVQVAPLGTCHVTCVVSLCYLTSQSMHCHEDAWYHSFMLLNGEPLHQQMAACLGRTVFKAVSVHSGKHFATLRGTPARQLLLQLYIYLSRPAAWRCNGRDDGVGLLLLTQL